MRLPPLSRSLVFATVSALILGQAMLHGAAGAAREDGQRASVASGKTSRPAKPRFKEYRIPAGTTLPIMLRSRLSSNENRPADAIEGRLLRPLTTREGVELVPAGAPVLGTVTAAEPAGFKQRGRLAFSFQVVEHPETASRAMIKAAMLTFESDIPVKGNVFTEVRLEKGADASVLLLAPLLVRIPN